MELYNEELRDLLCWNTASSSSTTSSTSSSSSNSSSSSSSLPIQEDGRGNVKIPGLTERTVRNADELMEVVRITESNRTVGSTAMNERSSRGHTIFRITYERREAADADAAAGWLPGVGGGGDAPVEEEEGGDEDKENDDARRDYHLRKGGGGGSNCRTRTRSGRKVITTVSSLNLVDLAGSESVRVTGATGERQKEGGKINQSLLTLSRVLSKLGKKDGGHINYRDSKLTRILKPSLSGNARMACICCISPDVKYLEESKSTLDFATRTMLVTTNAKSNTKVEYDDGLVEEFEREIERIKMETAKSEESRLRTEKALLETGDEIVCLKANIELALGRATSMERENKGIMTQLVDLTISNQKDRDGLLREICDLKTRNHELESTLIERESENEILVKRQEDERGSFFQTIKRIEAEQTSMAEEENRRIRDELKAAWDEVQTLRLRDTEITNKLSDRVTELERANDDLRGQLASSANIDGSAQDKVDSLASTIETLTKEKFQLESRLTKEIQKSTKRRDEAKERRQKFKGKLAGMAETLKDDLVQLSYQRE